MRKNPKVSIAIPTYNEADNIDACLESLYQQTYPNLEIILVDDGSTDQTVALVKTSFKTAPANIETKLLQQNHQGPGNARNLAVAESKGKIIVFFDADMTADADFVKNLTAPILQGEAKGTFSRSEFVANRDNSWAESWSIVRGFASGRMHPADYPAEQPVFRAILKSEFERVGGFSSDGSYDDDWSLYKKLKYKAKACDRAIFYHNNPASLSEIFTQSRWLSKREYKLGGLGKLIQLIRLNIVWSLSKWLGLSIKHQSVHLLLTGVVSDFGQSLGILETLWRANKAR